MTKGKSAVLLLFFSLAVRVPAEEDARDLLRRVSAYTLETIERLPRYVCTLTVDRVRYEPEKPHYSGNAERGAHSCDDVSAAIESATFRRRLSISDRLRLDVAVDRQTPNIENEMYAWVGADRFTGRSLFDMVPDGAVSTGSFASMLASVFGGKAARFSYLGDTNVGGRLLAEFGFRVPEELSEYLYIFGTQRQRQTAVAYQGTFLVDPATADLVRLEIHTGALPRETGACQLTQTLDYGRVRLNGADFLLPTKAKLVVTHVDQSQAENVIRYSACHEFRSESTLRAGTGPGPEAPVSLHSVPAGELSLPAGLHFHVVFNTRIDTESAGGDVVEGRLKGGIRDQSGRELVPDGSRVAGRILSIKRYYAQAAAKSSELRTADQPAVVLVIALEVLEMGGVEYPLHAAFNSGAGRFMKTSGALSRAVDLGSLEPFESGAGIFRFSGQTPDYVVESGLESNWVTTALPVTAKGLPAR